MQTAVRTRVPTTSSGDPGRASSLKKKAISVEDTVPLIYEGVTMPKASWVCCHLMILSSDGLIVGLVPGDRTGLPALVLSKVGTMLPVLS